MKYYEFRGKKYWAPSIDDVLRRKGFNPGNGRLRKEVKKIERRKMKKALGVFVVVEHDLSTIPYEPTYSRIIEYYFRTKEDAIKWIDSTKKKEDMWSIYEYEIKELEEVTL